jgi:hypothetical protein
MKTHSENPQKVGESTKRAIERMCRAVPPRALGPLGECRVEKEIAMRVEAGATGASVEGELAS